MDELAEEAPAGTAVIEPSGASPRLGVYAAAAGLATAVPVPFVDKALSGLARGAALRRVAKRRGVRLTREGRATLSGPRISRGAKARWLGRALSSALAPLRVASRLDDGVSTWAAAVLLDHYLATVPRRRNEALGKDEARRVRGAMDSAGVEAVLASLRDAPQAFVRTLAAAARSATELDNEDRTPVERVFDTLLDAAADAPDNVDASLKRAFDDALTDADTAGDTGSNR